MKIYSQGVERLQLGALRRGTDWLFPRDGTYGQCFYFLTSTLVIQSFINISTSLFQQKSLFVRPSVHEKEVSGIKIF